MGFIVAECCGILIGKCLGECLGELCIRPACEAFHENTTPGFRGGLSLAIAITLLVVGILGFTPILPMNSYVAGLALILPGALFGILGLCCCAQENSRL